jgi:hypothetical protein
MDLGPEPYQTELDEVVEKEIAAMIKKNEGRKKRKGTEGSHSITSGTRNDLDERLLMLEDFVERWDEKLELCGTMISKLHAV